MHHDDPTVFPDTEVLTDRHELNSPWWVSGTPLGTEHAHLMQRRYKRIPWEASTAEQLTPDQRAHIGRVWKSRTSAEHLAISTFSLLTMDLVAADAPADIISMSMRAGIDEIRHAELCIRMVEIYTGERLQPRGGMSRLPRNRKKPPLDMAVGNTLLVSCVSETFATTLLAAAREQSIDPTCQEVLTTIYSDEIMHARLGWSYLRWALERNPEQVRAAAADMIPKAVRGCCNVVELPRNNDPIPDELRHHGCMLPSEQRVVFSKCISEVVAPGFRALGIDVGSIVEDYDDAWAALPPPQPEPGDMSIPAQGF
jgi:hypothetical protein